MQMDHSWIENYKVTDQLDTRLDMMQGRLVSNDPFGMELLDPLMVDGKAIINIGCGTGVHDSNYFQRHAVRPTRYVLVDTSASMIQGAYNRVSPYFPSLETLTTSVDTLDPDIHGVFDVVICMHVLYHVPDPLVSLKKIARILNISGNALVTTTAHDENDLIHNIHRNILDREFGLRMPMPTSWIFDSSNAINLLGLVFHKVSFYYKIASLNFHDSDEALKYYQSLAYFRNAIQQGANEVKLSVCFKESAEEIIQKKGRLECRKDTVTFITSQPRLTE